MNNENLLKIIEIKNNFIKQEDKFDYKDKLLVNHKMENAIEPLLIDLIKYIFGNISIKSEFIRRINYINNNARILEKLADRQIKIIKGAIYESEDTAPFLSLQIEPIFKSLIENNNKNNMLRDIVADYKNLFIEDFMDTYCLYCFYARKNNYLNNEHSKYFDSIYNHFLFWHTIANSDSKIYKKNYIFQIQNVLRELEIFVKSDDTTELSAEDLEKIRKVNSLTPEENRLYKLLIKGKKEKECTNILQKELNTIQTQRKSIYQKLEVSTKNELISKYLTLFNLIG